MLSFSSPFNSNGIWQTQKGDRGIYFVTVTASDGEESVSKIVTVTITKAPFKEIRLARIRFLTGETIRAGDTALLSVSIENTGNKDMKNVKITAIIPELAVRDSVGPFNIRAGKQKTRTLYLRIPSWVLPGVYDVRIAVNANDYHRIKYRELDVV